MLEDVHQSHHLHLKPDFLHHFPVQGFEDWFAQVDLTARHYPLVLEGSDVPLGQQHPFVVIDDNRNHRGDDMFFFVFYLWHIRP